MVGRIKVDEAGVSALASALTSHAAEADDRARTADDALRAAESSVTSSPVAGALAEFVSSYAGAGSAVGEHIDKLSSVIAKAAAAVVAEDAKLASGATAHRSGE